MLHTPNAIACGQDSIENSNEFVSLGLFSVGGPAPFASPLNGNTTKWHMTYVQEIFEMLYLIGRLSPKSLSLFLFSTAS